MRTIAKAILALLLSPACGAAVVGQDDIAEAAILEDHSEALCLWHRKGFRDRVLVHFDRHDDFWSGRLTIAFDTATIRRELDGGDCAALARRTGNIIESDALYGAGDFIAPAFLLGVVKELWWVVPASSLPAAPGCAELREFLGGRYPAAFLDSLVCDGKTARGSYLGRPVHMVTLEGLPSLQAEVLLDVDMDYLSYLQEGPAVPSLLELARRFVKKLGGKGLRSDFVTVAASVGGGYFPLRYKYMAAYFAELLAKPGTLAQPPPAALEAQARFEWLLEKEDIPAARQENLRLAGLDERSPLPDLNEARLRGRGRDLAGLAKALERAAAKDPSYRYGYISFSQELHEAGAKELSRKLLERGLRRHPGYMPLYLELGPILLEQRRYAEAEAVYRSAIARNGRICFFYSGRAFALLHLGRFEEARRSMEHFLSIGRPGTSRDSAVRAWEVLTAERRGR